MPTSLNEFRHDVVQIRSGGPSRRRHAHNLVVQVLDRLGMAGHKCAIYKLCFKTSTIEPDQTLITFAYAVFLRFFWPRLPRQCSPTVYSTAFVVLPSGITAAGFLVLWVFGAAFFLPRLLETVPCYSSTAFWYHCCCFLCAAGVFLFLFAPHA